MRRIHIGYKISCYLPSVGSVTLEPDEEGCVELDDQAASEAVAHPILQASYNDPEPEPQVVVADDESATPPKQKANRP